jgi:hypothetical protein
VLVVLFTGCGATPETEMRLRLDAANPGRGELVRINLRCHPAGGTVTQPARVCAAIKRWPDLVLHPSLVNCKGGPSSHWRLRISGQLDGHKVDVRAETCDRPQTVLGALGIGDSHTVPSTSISVAAPRWLRRRASLLAVELNDPEPRSAQMSLGDPYQVTLWGDFDCRANCEQRYGAPAGHGHVATLTLDPRTRHATALTLTSP